MLDCPKCGKPVDGTECRHCGYAEIATAFNHKKRRGDSCAEPGCHRWGTFKPEDKPGPWHCFVHYPAIPMPQWFRDRHPQFAAEFKPQSDAEIEADLERNAIQGDDRHA